MFVIMLFITRYRKFRIGGSSLKVFSIIGVRELCPNNFEHNDGVKELRIILAF